MTKPIPPKQREEMSEDPFYRSCCIADSTCQGRIEWHHALIFGGKRQNDGILPVCQHHHRTEAKHRDKLNWVMLNRMNDEQLKKYSKAIDLFKKRDILNNTYGHTRRNNTKCDM